VGPPRNADYDAPPFTDGTTLAQIAERGAEWLVGLYCPKCIRFVKKSPAELSARLGPNATIADVKARMHCGECGRKDFVIKPALRSRRPARG